MYSSLETGLDLRINITPGVDVRNAIRAGFADLGSMIRDVIKQEAKKMGLVAVVIPEPAAPTVSLDDDHFQE